MNQSRSKKRRHAAAPIALKTIALCWCAAWTIHAQAANLVMAPQSPVSLVRACSMYSVDRPLALLPGDLLATKGQRDDTRLERDNGTIIALGPQTRMAVTPPLTLQGDAMLRSFSLLSGWLKISYSNQNPSEPIIVDTSTLHAAVRHGSVVIHATDTETEMFVETGEVIVEAQNLPAAAITLTSSAYLAHSSGQPPLQRHVPAAQFIDQMPVAFRDPLARQPVPASRFASSSSHAQRATYAMLADWLDSALPIRRTFVQRFRRLARSEPFRSEIKRNLRNLPEWRPVLYPPHPPVHRSAPISASRGDS